MFLHRLSWLGLALLLHLTIVLAQENAFVPNAAFQEVFEENPLSSEAVEIPELVLPNGNEESTFLSEPVSKVLEPEIGSPLTSSFATGADSGWTESYIDTPTGAPEKSLNKTDWTKAAMGVRRFIKSFFIFCRLVINDATTAIGHTFESLGNVLLNFWDTVATKWIISFFTAFCRTGAKLVNVTSDLLYVPVHSIVRIYDGLVALLARLGASARHFLGSLVGATLQGFALLVQNLYLIVDICKIAANSFWSSLLYLSNTLVPIVSSKLGATIEFAARSGYSLLIALWAKVSGFLWAVGNGLSSAQNIFACWLMLAGLVGAQQFAFSTQNVAKSFGQVVFPGLLIAAALWQFDSSSPGRNSLEIFCASCVMPAIAMAWKGQTYTELTWATTTWGALTMIAYALSLSQRQINVKFAGPALVGCTAYMGLLYLVINTCDRKPQHIQPGRFGISVTPSPAKFGGSNSTPRFQEYGSASARSQGRPYRISEEMEGVYQQYKF